MIPKTNEFTRAESGLVSRLFAAWARPWTTSYVSPTIMTLDATLYALAGYEVHWSPVRVDREGDREPSSLYYDVFKMCGGERLPSHGVGIRSVFPAWAHRLECRYRNWQLRRMVKR